MTNIETLRLVLDAIEAHNSGDWGKANELFGAALPVLSQAIEQAEQAKPVGVLRMGPKQDFVTTEAAGDLEINTWHDLYTAPPPRQPLTEWQPIETAPFNTDLLVINNGFISQGYRSGQYQNTWTHWMPLPAPPIEDAHGIKEKNK